jgi:hypothetical protein
MCVMEGASVFSAGRAFLPAEVGLGPGLAILEFQDVVMLRQALLKRKPVSSLQIAELHAISLVGSGGSG